VPWSAHGVRPVTLKFLQEYKGAVVRHLPCEGGQGDDRADRQQERPVEARE